MVSRVLDVLQVALRGERAGLNVLLKDACADRPPQVDRMQLTVSLLQSDGGRTVVGAANAVLDAQLLLFLRIQTLRVVRAFLDDALLGLALPDDLLVLVADLARLVETHLDLFRVLPDRQCGSLGGNGG